MAEANHCARLIWTAAFSTDGHWQKEEGIIIIIMERERLWRHDGSMRRGSWY